MKQFTLFGFAALIFLQSCSDSGKKPPLFSLVSSESSGITFSNDLKEDENFNIVEYLYFYNGGGVATGDVNNDGLIDIYFVSNQNSNKLYLNKGDFKFEDITEKAGVAGTGNWKTGVTMADINGDGFLDMYVCGVDGYKEFKSKNQLFINNGDLTFTDRTVELGLNFSGRSTQAVFFDYDLDGDLDCYLLNHSVQRADSYISISHRLDADSLNGDKFFRNELIETGQPTFTNITKETGIFSSRLGYGLGVAVSDINLDGYPDIYVSNDFQENDYLYLNNGNGTFRQVMEKSMAHTSRFSMGVDVADFNNDGRSDVISMDMLPRDEAIIKTSAGEDGYEVYKYKLKYGYHYQVARNCLQVNRAITDSTVLFSDVALQAGVAATDWSWSPLMVDFDNDGLKDLFVSNGIVRRPNDLDYINFISNQAIQDSLKTMEKSDMTILNHMPASKISNFIFRNRGGLGFEDTSESWGLNRISISNGASYADFDNDGDLDLVINNLNEQSFLYRNNADTASYLKINFAGDKANRSGLGTKVLIYADGRKLYYEVTSTRGFCSSSDTRVNAGLGKAKIIDSLIIIWPTGSYQKFESVKANQTLSVKYSEAKGRFNYKSLLNSTPFMTASPKNEIPDFAHKEDDFNAFNNEGLMPHMLTTQGPPIIKGDVNGDGLEDVLIGGGKDQPAALFLQTADGKWKRHSESGLAKSVPCEDVAAEFFDADGDKDLDLMIVSGGQSNEGGQESIRPRFYRNDGGGNFRIDETSVSGLSLQASCVKACDFDKDGDVDVFIGGSVIPFLYGMAPPSFLMANDGKGHFTPIQNWLGSSEFDNSTKTRPGMVKDAVWTDINKDGLTDLILVGEWMPVTVLIQNPKHQFDNRTNEFGMKQSNGWWNMIVAADIDLDGDDDYIAGNLGFNSRLKATPENPVRMYLGDFDSNGGSDHVLTYYNGGKNYPFASRDQMVKQLPALKKKFLKYRDYRNVNLEDIVTPKMKGNLSEMHVDNFGTSLIRNDRTGLVISPLPEEAQIAPVYGICVADVNNDGFPDVLLGGNLNATQPDFGPYDASIGLLLLGDGKGNWKPVDAMNSGFQIRGEVRDIQVINRSNNEKIVLVSRNNQSIVGFKTGSK